MDITISHTDACRKLRYMWRGDVMLKRSNLIKHLTIRAPQSATCVPGAISTIVKMCESPREKYAIPKEKLAVLTDASARAEMCVIRGMCSLSCERLHHTHECTCLVRGWKREIRDRKESRVANIDALNSTWKTSAKWLRHGQVRNSPNCRNWESSLTDSCAIIILPMIIIVNYNSFVVYLLLWNILLIVLLLRK